MTHLKCNPQIWGNTSKQGGLHLHERKVQMGLPQGDLLPLPKSFQAPESPNSRRVLSGLRLQPQIRYSAAAMWMSSHQHTSSLIFISYDCSTSRLKRDLLLCVARPTAVTLTSNAPLSKAQGPGISVSRVEPSGVFLSRFSQPSSRSLGLCLLLGQRSRMNWFFHHIGSLLHQDHRNPHTQFARHRHNDDPLSSIARLSAANRAEKLSKFAVLSDRRPGSLDEFTSEPAIPAMSDRPSVGFIAGGVLRRNQAQKSSQLADVFKLPPIADPGQKLAGHNPADPRHRHHILDTPRQFGIVLTETADLLGRLKNLLFIKIQAVEQLIELKAHGRRTRKCPQLLFHDQRPLTAGRCGGNSIPSKSNSDLMRCFIPTISLTKVSRS